MRNVIRSGLVGAVPGLLLLAVSVAVEAWVESGGGIGFGLVGMLLLWVGVFLGMLRAATRVEYGGRLLLGVGCGFVVGLVGGMALVAGDVAPTGPLWVLLVPVGMFTGGLLVAWLVEHGAGHPTPNR